MLTSLLSLIKPVTSSVMKVLDKFIGTKMSEEVKAKISNELTYALMDDLQKHEEMIVKLQTWDTGSKVANGIRAMVRPIIALTFLFLYLADKFAWLAVQFTDFDRQIWAGIVGFYFILRTGEKIFSKDK